MCHVEFPHVVLVAKLDTFPEYLLDLSIVLSIPVDPGLGHQHWDIAREIIEKAQTLYIYIDLYYRHQNNNTKNLHENVVCVCVLVISLLQSLVVLLHTSLDSLVVVILAMLLNLLGQLAECLGVTCGKHVEFLKCLQ